MNPDESNISTGATATSTPRKTPKNSSRNPSALTQFHVDLSRIDRIGTSLNTFTANFQIIPPQKFGFQPKNIRDGMKLKHVILQNATRIADDASHSAYNLSFDTKLQMSYIDFAKKAREMEKTIGNHSIAQYEDLHWQSLSSRCDSADSCVPLYAIDNEISLFPESCQIWNLNKFTYADSIIHRSRVQIMPGIHRPFLNIGMPLTSFAFHIEDGDLDSINYLHHGKPKVWYFVYGADAPKLEQLAKKLTLKRCNLYIRHKTLMIPPSLLQKHGIRFARVVQEPGEFIVSFAGGYHMGFNCGLNASEAINFATPEWLNFFPQFETCGCQYAVETIKIQSELEKIYSAEKLPPHKQPPTKRTTRRSIGSSRAPLMSAHLIGLEQTSTRKAPGLYSCDQCATTFTLNKNLLAHKRIQHGKYIVFYECSICAEKYISKYLLKYHCADKHGIELKDVKWHEKRVRNSSKNQSERKKKFVGKVKRNALTCEVCGLVTHGTYNMNRHKRIKHITLQH